MMLIHRAKLAISITVFKLQWPKRTMHKRAVA